VTEYRTKPLDNALLRAELQFVCDAFRNAELKDVAVSFGWDSNLPIERMWQEQFVSIDEVVATIEASERSGISQIGKSDIFVESPGFLFMLCHEGDVHVKGSSVLVERFARRWQALDYAPYRVHQGA
jgi:hypothetical protein